MKATLTCRPDAQVGEKWGLYFGSYNDPDMVILEGFETIFDAWVFAVAHTMIDPCENTPAHRQWTNCPDEVKPTQMKMFMEDK